ncbi:MAG TPA: DNA polymerase domain-containing protein [Anaerolineales bacterium]
MVEHTGWLLDLYPDPEEGNAVLWLLCDDGERRRLRQELPVTFYAAGPNERLRALWGYLDSRSAGAALSRAERRDLFEPALLTVMEIRVKKAAEQPGLFKDIQQGFPDLDYYDADIPLLARFAAGQDIFPLTRCRAVASADGWVQEIRPTESRWAIDPALPPLRVLHIEPNTDPNHAAPASLIIKYERYRCQLPLKPDRPLLASLSAILRRYDPDLILTTWGDTWILPYLLEISQNRNDRLPLNRDSGREAIRKAAHTYFSYGQVIHRGQQVNLLGRWHIDRLNAMMFGDYGLDGVVELARVSGLPVQTVARNSPGAGITAMQIITALRRGILVPYHKQQTERFKSALDLINLDRGGLVYQPLIGLHKDVAEIDFISMYPSIMRVFNISPENTGRDLAALDLKDADAFAEEEQPGLLPETLSPLLDKRIAIKEKLAVLSPKDCRYKAYKARSAALKWLLVVCFGYTGYKNAKFGRIESHQAITAYAREVLLAAKEVAEGMGYTVLHMYIDGLWVQKPGACSVSDFQPLLDEIASRTRLPIALDGIYRWVAFLPSKLDRRVPVPNRYFGVFQSGEVKIRGIEARRQDTPEFIARTQKEMLRRLAKAPTAEDLPALLPEVVALARKCLADLRCGKLDAEQLLVTQKLSRSLSEYSVPSPAALAAMQLEAAGKPVRAGQSVRFLFVRGEQKVAAWDLAGQSYEANIDKQRYAELLARAAAAVLGPVGVNERTLRDWLFSNAGYNSRPGYQAAGADAAFFLPLI